LAKSLYVPTLFPIFEYKIEREINPKDTIMISNVQKERKLGWEKEIQYLNEKLEGCELDNQSYRSMILTELQFAYKSLLNVIELEIELNNKQ
jgi:hypothetical protein